MLFTPQDEAHYRLWTTRRCGWVLSIGIVLFSLFVFISFYFIQIRPSFEATITENTSKIGLDIEFNEPQSVHIHNPLSIDYVRFIKNDGSAEIIAFQSLDPYTLKAELPEHKAAFIVAAERNLWQFLYERWLLMWRSSDD